jgi:hypothetical protein
MNYNGYVSFNLIGNNYIWCAGKVGGECGYCLF